MAQPGRELGGEQRMPTELEEVIVHADTFEPEQALPDVADCLFELVARFHIRNREIGTGVRAVEWRARARCTLARGALPDVAIDSRGKIGSRHGNPRDRSAGEDPYQALDPF